MHILAGHLKEGQRVRNLHYRQKWSVFITVMMFKRGLRRVFGFHSTIEERD
jgi:hypothetical protein